MFSFVLVNGLIIGAVYGLIALGYSLIYRASGLMSFLQGDIITVGAYLGISFYRYLGLPILVSFALTFACAFLLGIVLERGVIRIMVKRNVLAIYIVLGTIAISYIIQNTFQMAYGTIALRFPQIFSSKTLTIFGVTNQTEAYACLIVSVLVMLILHFFMKKTTFGIAMRAAAMDTVAAESCGINTSLTVGVTWGVSAALASLAGMLIGPMYGVYVVLGATIGRKGFAGAVMGGFGNMYGAMIGGLILGLVETFAASYWIATYQNLVAFALLLIFLFIKPTGIFNEQAIQDV